MTSIFLELQLQGLSHPRDKRDVENSECRAILLKMISQIPNANRTMECAQKHRFTPMCNYFVIAFDSNQLPCKEYVQEIVQIIGFSVTVAVIPTEIQMLFRLLKRLLNI